MVPRLQERCRKLHVLQCNISKFLQGLKERSRPSVSNVKSADVRLATTQSRERHWSTSRNPSVNGTDCSAEIIQRDGRDGSFKDTLHFKSQSNNVNCNWRY